MRPHRGKELPVNVLSVYGTHNQTSEEYLRYAYGEQFDMFFSTLNSIVTSRGGDLATNQRRFSTKFWDQIYADYVEVEEDRNDGSNGSSVVSVNFLSYPITILVAIFSRYWSC